MKFNAYIDSNGELIVEGPFFQDGGWYAKDTMNGWELFEIPLYGGKEQFNGVFKSFPDAAKYAIENFI